MTGRMGIAASLLGLLAALPAGPAGAGAALRVCAAGHEGFSIGPDPLADGPVAVPRGTVFRSAGRRLDLSRVGKGGEAARRPAPAADGEAALVTEGTGRLTRDGRCTSVPVAALVSPRFGWSAATVRGDGAERYRPYGTVERGRLDLAYAGADAAFRRAAIRGEIEASFAGETRHTVRLKRRELDVIARHRGR